MAQESGLALLRAFLALSTNVPGPKVIHPP